jgi:FkbM family methyltransferase
MYMRIKKLLRTRGYDIIRYYSYPDSYLKPLGIRTILDIGANTGEFSKEMRSLFPDAHIYAFEPLKDCYTHMKERMQGDTKFTPFNMALGDTNEESVIQRSSFHPSSSLLPMADVHKKLYPKSKDSTEEKILIRRLDDVLKDEEFAAPIFIKMDVQGFEGNVIRGGPTVIQRASILQVETSFVPLYEGQPLFGDIHDQLRALGFSYQGPAASHRDPTTGRFIYQDAIFSKD